MLGIVREGAKTTNVDLSARYLERCIRLAGITHDEIGTSEKELDELVLGGYRVSITEGLSELAREENPDPVVIDAIEFYIEDAERVGMGKGEADGYREKLQK